MIIKPVFILAAILMAIGCTGTEIDSSSIPEGMVYVPGGTTIIGSDQGLPNEKPEFETNVEPFLMDKNLVTVAEFRSFVEEAGYETEAEKIGDGVVFDFERAEWAIVEGANWEYPNGPGKEAAEDDHPVRQVSWNDAVAYLEWAGKRLPAETEWEHAAKGGEHSGQPYAWGDSLVMGNQYQANTWNGTFPTENIPEDGYMQTSPVGKFNINELELSDMGGNVWEWTENWYQLYENKEEYQPVPVNEKVIRGGSFMCHISYCHGYRVSARSHTPPDNALFHVGFRGVRDI